MLCQCLNMLVSSFRVRKKELETLFLIGTDSIKDPICGKSVRRHGLNYCGTKDCEESELLYDLKNKHLVHFGPKLNHIQPTTLNKIFKGIPIGFQFSFEPFYNVVNLFDFRFSNRRFRYPVAFMVKDCISSLCTP